ncbi:StAR-related lipid transfer protein 3 [Schistosoma japonicum]|nr:StAR-related lipid transfer protein 3 [Schistosoma japonicum]
MRETDVNVDFSSLYNNQFGLLFGRSEFILLETTYGAIRSRGPWWSAISTGLTTYAVLIASLIISWIETTFLIYRVIPQEKAADRVTMCLKEQDETRSLLSARFGNRVPFYSGLSVRSMSNADFYTPQGSVFGDESHVKLPICHNLEAAVDVAALLHRTASLQTEMWNLYEHDIWGDNSPSVNIQYPFRSEALPNYPSKVYRIEVGLVFIQLTIFPNTSSVCNDGILCSSRTKIVVKRESLQMNLTECMTQTQSILKM